ncbi:MAG: hypothetical protein AAFY71_24525 [Bacteroidota bacterium]
MASVRDNQAKILPWPVRRLLILFRVSKTPHQKTYKLIEFLFPINYPKTLSIAKNELNQIIKTLGCLHDVGVEVEPIKHYSDIPWQLSSKVKLKVNQQLLKKRLTAYLKAYGRGTIRFPKAVFGVSLMQQLFHTLLKKLQFRQDSQPRFTLGKAKEDELLTMFKEKLPEEYWYWSKSRYSLPFWHHLLYLHTARKLTIQAIQVAPSKLRKKSLRVGCSILLLLPQIKGEESKIHRNDTIVHISVSEPITGQFFVYLNHNQQKPIFMTRNRKSNEIFYLLARDGFVDFSQFKRVYEYIRSDSRFVLFAQSGYALQPLITKTKQGTIIPHEKVTITLKVITD